MNYREDLETKLQKVTLAIQEVAEDVYKTEQEKQKIIFFFNEKDNFFKLMNYREDLEIKLQKVTLAMQEVVEDIYKTDREKERIISKLIEFKEAIISKGIELNIELEAA